MIHPDDEQMLHRLLGSDPSNGQSIPAVVAAECELWAKMTHRCGASGAIGYQLLIPMVRHLGLGPPQVAEKQPDVDWHKTPAGTRIEAHYLGGWQSGVFHGLAPHGALAIRLDCDSGEIREWMPRIVRLAKTPEEVCDTLSQTVAEVTTPAAKTAVEEPSTEAVEETIPVHPTITDPLKWLQANKGDAVYAQREGEYVDAKFVKVGKASRAKGVQTLHVRFDGDEEAVEVPVDLVTLAS